MTCHVELPIHAQRSMACCVIRPTLLHYGECSVGGIFTLHSRHQHGECSVYCGVLCDNIPNIISDTSPPVAFVVDERVIRSPEICQRECQIQTTSV